MIIKILGISGSLKSGSVNTNILKAISALAPGNVVVKIYNAIDSLPHFNPDLNGNLLPVTNFRQKLKEADGVIISTPEYAFGVPGVLKNALDWVVSSGELNKKPVVAISASPLFSGGDKALASLLLTLTALGANMDADSSLSINDVKSKITETGEISNNETISKLKLLLDKLTGNIAF
jgi:NAD(P)H-dependent FMN reductase